MLIVTQIPVWAGNSLIQTVGHLGFSLEFFTFLLKNGFRESFKDMELLINVCSGFVFKSCVYFFLFCILPLRPSGPSKALKLGAKGKEVDNFVDKLKSEGETIMSSNMGKRMSEATKVHVPPINMER